MALLQGEEEEDPKERNRKGKLSGKTDIAPALILSVLVAINVALLVTMVVRATEDHAKQSKATVPTRTKNDTERSFKQDQYQHLVGEIQEMVGHEYNKSQMEYLGWGREIDLDPNVMSPSSRGGRQAHLNDVIEDDCGAGPKVLCWDVTCDSSYCNPPVTYSAGRIQVKNSGYYFIYSHLRIKNRNTSVDPDGGWFVHTMHREAPPSIGRRWTLMENKQTLTSEHNNNSNATSYLGAVFFLYEKERVYVRVISDIAENLGFRGSYFGLFKI